MTPERQKGSFPYCFSALQERFSLQLQAFLFIFSLGQTFFCHKLRNSSVDTDKIPLEMIGIFLQELQNWVAYHQECFG